jgi:hypothetical protein
MAPKYDNTYICAGARCNQSFTIANYNAPIACASDACSPVRMDCYIAVTHPTDDAFVSDRTHL